MKKRLFFLVFLLVSTNAFAVDRPGWKGIPPTKVPPAQRQIVYLLDNNGCAHDMRYVKAGYVLKTGELIYPGTKIPTALDDVSTQVCRNLNMATRADRELLEEEKAAVLLDLINKQRAKDGKAPRVKIQ